MADMIDCMEIKTATYATFHCLSTKRKHNSSTSIQWLLLNVVVKPLAWWILTFLYLQPQKSCATPILLAFHFHPPKSSQLAVVTEIDLCPVDLGICSSGWWRSGCHHSGHDNRPKHNQSSFSRRLKQARQWLASSRQSCVHIVFSCR